MNLERAILNVLEVSPRPITTKIIASLVGQFNPRPALPVNIDKATARVLELCEQMEMTGDVMFQASRDFGQLWSITKIGKARIA